MNTLDQIKRRGKTILLGDGVRRVMGTDWPIESIVSREVHFGRPYWLLTINQCNGTCSGTERFTTRKAALAALAALGEKDKTYDPE